MIQRVLVTLALVLGSAISAPARAQVPPDVAALAEALRWGDIVAILRDEGIQYGDELAGDLFPGRSPAEWSALVEVIYDEDRMNAVSRAAFAKSLEDTDTSGLTAFFQGELGKEIVALEISARRALMDDAVEEASKQAVRDMAAAGDPRLKLLADFVEANDLLEANVVGALNSNYAFYNGLADGGAFPEPPTQEQILTDVWSQEEAIRQDTEEWLYSYLALAYQPLSDEDLQAYIDLSLSPEGQALNKALFDGFDTMFDGISRALGLAAARMMAGEDL